MRLERIFQMKFVRITNLITFSKLSFSPLGFLFVYFLEAGKRRNCLIVSFTQAVFLLSLLAHRQIFRYRSE